MTWRANPRILGLLLAAATLLVFWPVSNCDFVSYDDGEYFNHNWEVQAGLTGSGIAWAFQTGHAANWHPITWLSLMLDAQVFGTGPRGPHLTNLLFHVANALLLFAWLRRLTGLEECSAFVAALFALHPLHVESVAWVAERKDVLSTFWFLLSLLAYARYAQSRQETQSGPTVPEAKRHRALALTAKRQDPVAERRSQSVPAIPGLPLTKLAYLLALVCFAFSLMSKPMAVTLPFLLLLLDYWPLRRISLGTSVAWLRQLKWLLWEKVPFLLLSAASCVVTLIVQAKGGAVRNLASLPLSARLENALVAYARYLGKALWPVDLAVLYPHPGHWPWLQVALSGLLMAAICGVVFRSRSRFPFLFSGWFWFVGTLVPVIGLVQVGLQSMADRYTYVPLIGVFIALVWGGREWWSFWRWPVGAARALSLVVLAACAWQTRNQLAFWDNGETLFRHTVAVTTNNRQALGLLDNDLGNTQYRQGHLEAALQNYRHAVELYPEFNAAHNNLGLVLAATGHWDEAIASYQRALELQPDYANAHVNLADALWAQGQAEQALAHYHKALELEPRSIQALNNLAAALVSQKHYAEALEYCHQITRWAPGYAGAHKLAGKALTSLGRLSEARASFDAALAINPTDAEVHFLVAGVLLQQGDRLQAQKHFSEALRLKPDHAEAARQLKALSNSP